MDEEASPRESSRNITSGSAIPISPSTGSPRETSAPPPPLARHPLITQESQTANLNQVDVILQAADENNLITNDEYVNVCIAIWRSTTTQKADLAIFLSRKSPKLDSKGVAEVLRQFIIDSQKLKVERVCLKQGAKNVLEVTQVADYKAQTHIPSVRGAHGVVRCVKLKNGTLLAERKITYWNPGNDLELDILHSIDNEHCVKLYASFTRDTVEGMTLLTEPWCNYDLKNLLRDDVSKLNPDFNHFMKEDNKLQFFLNLSGCILAGLSYLHSQRIAHNDIKPGNILIYYDPKTPTSPPIPKITDFGFPAFLNLDSSSKSTDRRGRSNFYISPELLYQSHRSYSRTSDLWSVALVIVECLLKGEGIPKTWKRMKDEENGFGPDGPVTCLRGDLAVEKALCWVLQPCTSTPVKEVQGCLQRALSTDPSDREDSTSMWRNFAEAIARGGITPHCRPEGHLNHCSSICG